MDWTSIRKKDGLAFSTETGTNHGPAQYDDSNACLSGFPPNQEAWGEVVIAKPESSCNQEVEILLRWTISEHSTTGYECMGRCISGGSSYLEIVRWEGPLGKFTYLTSNKRRAPNSGLKNGDILKASAVGNVITLYVNGVEKLRAVDDTYPDGKSGHRRVSALREQQGPQVERRLRLQELYSQGADGSGRRRRQAAGEGRGVRRRTEGRERQGLGGARGPIHNRDAGPRSQRSEGKKTMVFHAKGNEWMGCGWNWFGWDPEDAGTDISKQKNVSFWAKVTGKQKPDGAYRGTGRQRQDGDRNRATC